MEVSNVLFTLTNSNIQDYSMNYIGRKLDESELLSAKKYVESGILTSIDIIFRAAIDAIIEKKHSL